MTGPDLGAAPAERATPFALDRTRVHADPALLPPETPHLPLLEPFWGSSSDKYGDEASPLAGRFGAWRTSGAEHFDLAPLERADVVVLPAGWEHYARHADRRAAVRDYAGHIRASGRPFVVFFGGDSTEPVPLPGAHVFRASLLRSRRGEREHLMPALASDLVREDLGGELPLRPRRSRPVVGFCGYAPDVGPRGWLRHVARGVLRRPPHPAHVRTRACRRLRRSRRVDTNFVFRSGYWAGAVRPDGSLDLEVMRKARAEFVANIVESDYVLAVRGGGNYSFRFYETLSCGRVPVFVDTDSILPLEDELDWSKLCIRVAEAELDEIAERVATFHAEVGPDGFLERQRACRQAFVEHLTPEAYFRSLAPVLRRLAP